MSELRASDMGEDKIRYLLPVSGRDLHVTSQLAQNAEQSRVVWHRLPADDQIMRWKRMPH